MRWLVYLTTSDHLRRFRQLIAGATREDLRRGRFQQLDDLPHVAPMYGLLGMRFPVPYLAHGVLTLDRDTLRFRSVPPRLWGNAVRNLRSLSMALSLQELVQVERLDFESPIATRGDLVFTRLRTTQVGLTSDFLIGSAASKFSLEKQRQRSVALLAEFERLCRESGWASGQASGLTGA